MDKEDFEHYHETKFIESLTSLIDQKEVNEDVISYLKHTLNFLEYNDIIADAWVELLKLLNSHLLQIYSLEEAQNYLNEFVNTSDKIGKKYEGLGLLLFNCFQNNKLDQALETVNRQIDLVEYTDHVNFKSIAYRNKGAIYHVSGQIEEAESWYQKAYELNNVINSYQIKDQNLYVLANLYMHYLGKFEEAFNYYSRAKDLAVAEENMEREAFYLDHMGMAKYWSGKYQEAVPYHENALQILESGDRNTNILYNQVQLAMAFAKMDNYQATVDRLVSVLDLKENNQDPYSNCLFLILLAEAISKGVIYDKNKFNKVIKVELEEKQLLQEAKNIAETTKNTPALVHVNLALAKYMTNEDPAYAISLISEAKQIALSNNRRREIHAIKDHLETIGIDFDTL